MAQRSVVISPLHAPRVLSSAGPEQRTVNAQVLGSNPREPSMSTNKSSAQKEAKALARAEYKAEGKRRMIARKKRRHERRVETAKYRHRYGHWQDSESYTGYSQSCEMGGTCPYPCNGDC